MSNCLTCVHRGKGIEFQLNTILDTVFTIHNKLIRDAQWSMIVINNVFTVEE